MHFDNVFYDRYHAVKHYKCQKEVWEESKIISLIDTDERVGLFGCSDIIIAYDDTEHPTVITERIYRRNYKWHEWLRIKMYLRTKISVIRQELGFNIAVTFGRNYIDYIHYTEEWWKWASKNAKLPH